MSDYNPKEIEAKWQKKWLEEKVFAAHDGAAASGAGLAASASASAKPKYYQLETFPYPSGAGLHVGHPKGYIAEDIHARYMRMGGDAKKTGGVGAPREVLYTMGWDAFGLPTENYAMKVGKSPREVTRENTDNFRRQLRMFGFSYDWDREINTSSPEYYKWTQWLFIQLFKHGLAYRATAKVNWCPKDQTVLANEQVIAGKCERCGSEIEERDMEQWFLRITKYADRLLADLAGLDWPAATIKRQEDWIGKSEGAEISFALDFKKNPADNERRGQILAGGERAEGGRAALTVFTTRPDTLFGATYLVLAPEHPWVTLALDDQHDILLNKDEVRAYVAAASHKTERMRQEEVKEKTGVELCGVRAINPANDEEIPIWVADYVLGSYGTGAIMAVPAHDERDFEFAKKFGLPIKQVIEPETGNVLPDEQTRKNIVAIVEDPESKKFLTLNWGSQLGGTLFIGGGRESDEDEVATALREIREEVGYTELAFVGKTRRMHHHYFAFAKNIPRNIEVVGLHFKLSGKAMVIPNREKQETFTTEWLSKEEILGKIEDENHLLAFRELILGEIYTGKGLLTNSGKFNGKDSETAKWEIVKFVGATKKTQYRIRDWSVSRQRYWGVPIPMIHCEKGGIVPVPDADLPVLLPDLENFRPQGTAPLASSPEFMNVKCPQCGGDAKRDPETLDTFVDSSWYYLRYTDPHNADAIFDPARAAHWLPVDLYVIGAEHTVLHLLYARFITKFLHDEKLLNFNEPFIKLRHQGLIRGTDGAKMSKSKGNVVNPDEIVGEFGADTVRMYEMFMGPFEDGAPWDPKSILGVERFLKRFWKYAEAQMSSDRRQAATDESTKTTKALLHKTIKKVGEDIESFKFNTAISALMILLNELEKTSASTLAAEDIKSLLKILHPFAPHMAQELWSQMEMDGGNTAAHGASNTTYLDFEPWPQYDSALIKEEKIKLVFQVNSRVRDSVEVDAAITEDEAKKLALANAKVKLAMEAASAATGTVSGVTPKKIIYVDKKLVNVVI